VDRFSRTTFDGNSVGLDLEYPKVRNVEPEHSGLMLMERWHDKLTNLPKRWGGAKVISHSGIFYAQALPALITG
jgi:hypothetical protein